MYLFVSGGQPMETLFICILAYFAVGAALFAHPAAPACPNDFHWKSQVGVFFASLPEVLAWPLALYRVATAGGR